MKRRSYWLWGMAVIAMIALPFMVSGCKESPDGEEETSELGRSVADEIGTELETNTDLSDAQITAITDAAVSAIESDLAESDYESLDSVLPKAVEGAQEGLGGIADADMTDGRSEVVDSIVGAAIGSIGSQSSSSRRQLSADDMVALIQSVSDAAVSALDEAGFTSDNLPDAVKGAVKSAVSQMGRSGITRASVETALNGIASGAAKSVKNTNATADTAAALLNKASRGAAAGVADVDVTGFDPDEEFGRAVGLVAKGITGVLDEVDISDTDMESLIGAVTEGATDAIQDVSLNLDAEKIGKAVKAISAGAASALVNLQSGVTDVNALVKKVAKSTTEAAKRIADAKFLSDDDLATLVSSVASGTAEGATESGVDTTQLQTLISESLNELSAQLAALQASLDALLETAVAAGIVAGQNAAPVAVATVSSESITLGADVTLDATDSTDADGDTLSYLWEIVFPSGTSGIEDEEAASTTFTPAVAGDYLIILTVSDGKEEDDSFVTISVAEPTVGTGDLSDADKQTILELAIGYMSSGNLEQAANKFNTLVTADPTYMPGVMGAIIMDFASIAKAADVQTFAKDVLGFTKYPSTLSEIIDPESWMQEFYVTYWYGWDQYSYYQMFPYVRSQADLNGDNVVDWSERMVAMIENILEYYMEAGTSTQDTVDTFLDFIVDRIANAESMIDAVTSDASFTLTYDMLQWASWADAREDGWPYTKDTSNNEVPLTFTIGKAELDSILASFKLLETWAYLVKMFDFSIDITGIDFNLDAEEGEFYVDFNGWQPFSATDLGEMQDDAADSIASAKAAMLSALDTLEASLTEIQGRTGSTFTLSSGSSILQEGTILYMYSWYEEYDEATGDWEYSYQEDSLETGLTWSVIDGVADFSQVFLAKLEASVNSTSTPFVCPTDYMDFDNPIEYMFNYSTEAAWPTEADLYFTTETGTWEEWDDDLQDWVEVTEEYDSLNVDAVSANLGALFASPIGGLSMWLDMDADGEPVFYIVDEDTESMVAASASTFDATDVQEYYIKLNDITFGGIIPEDNLPDTITGLNDVTYPGVYFDDSGDGIAMYINVGTASAGHSLAPAGTEFIVDRWDEGETEMTESEVSTGSFWTGLAYSAIFHHKVEIYYIDSEDWNDVYDPDTNEYLGTYPVVYIVPSQTIQLKVYMEDWNGRTYRPPYDGLVFTSNDTSVATVDSSSGKVTGVSQGVAEITAEYTDADGDEMSIVSYVVVSSTE